LLVSLLTQFHGSAPPFANTAQKPLFGTGVYYGHRFLPLLLQGLLGYDCHYDTGGKYKNHDYSNLVQGFVRTAADGVNFSAAAQAGTQASASCLNQNKDGNQHGSNNGYIVPDVHYRPILTD
jgi:hypothetical protein